MRILLTNDDGVGAPGLVALEQALAPLAELTIVAPHMQRSASGHALTFTNPLRVVHQTQRDGLTEYAIDGTPTDCVIMALYSLLPERPDLVISGINCGANMGFDVTYSGTVSAAMEALIHGVPSLAVSLAGRSPANFATAGACTVKLLKSLIAKNSPWPQSKQTFLSVNVPDCPLDELKGWRLARQGRSIYRQYVEKSRDPWGQDYYWIGGDIPQAVPELGTDFSAVQEGYVSVTPLEPDLTARAYLDQAQQKGLGALLENWKG